MGYVSFQASKKSGVLIEKNSIQEKDLLFYPHNFPITTFTTTRSGGLSTGTYGQFNLSYDVGDDPKAVDMNRAILQSYLRSQGVKHMIEMKQTHGTKIVFVDENSPSLIEDCDAMITMTPSIALAVKHADCQAALFFDSQKKIIAAVHAGWRGLVNQLYEKVLTQLIKIGSNPENLYVFISPSLGPQSAQFIDAKKLFPPSFLKYEAKKDYYKLWDIALMQLTSGKVNPKNIYFDRSCTREQHKRFFSYRKNKLTGRNMSIISLQAAS